MTSSSGGGGSRAECAATWSTRPHPLGDVEALLPALVGQVFGLDEPFPFEALEGRVHLPDVERRHSPVRASNSCRS